jgi:IS6 family transposase
MNPFHGRHFQGEIILWAVRWYCKYGISYRELQEMLAERGVNVDHTTIYRWVQRYAPEMENVYVGIGVIPTDRHLWHLDETYVKVNGKWAYLYTVQLTNVAILLISIFLLDEIPIQLIVFLVRF